MRAGCRVAIHPPKLNENAEAGMAEMSDKFREIGEIYVQAP